MAAIRTIAVAAVVLVAGECWMVDRAVSRWLAQYPTPIQAAPSRTTETRRAVSLTRPVLKATPRRKVWCAEMPIVALWCPTAEQLPE